jgi:hypothetical protein
MNKIRAMHTSSIFLQRFSLLSALAAAGMGSVGTGHAELIAFWDFNTSSPLNVTIDVRAGKPGQFLAGAALSPDAGGRTGAAGDKAARFGANQRIQVLDATFLNATAATDIMSVSLWIKHVAIRNSTAFSIVQPTAAGLRGFQSHLPWGDSTIYFDTGGCCDATMRTQINMAGTDFTAWHHIALVKNGAAKEIWVDGLQRMTGTNTAPITSGFSTMYIGGAAANTGEYVNGDIDDFAIFSSALTPAEIASLSGGTSPLSLAGIAANDSDADGLPDMWEYSFFPADLTKLAGGAADRDQDGLTDSVEFAGGLNPSSPDTDGDGFTDRVETNTGTWVSASDTGTSPLNPDTDNDGLKDGAETNTGTFVNTTNAGTNPFVTDTDGDLSTDGQEVTYGSNPVNAVSIPGASGVPLLLAWWKFDDSANPAVAVDTRAGYSGAIAGAVYTADAGGATGLPGDKALSLTPPGQRVVVANTSWLNIGTRLDRLTYSFWQKLNATPASSSFWTFSASSADGQRGFQAHNPYSNNNIYFDSGGAVAAGTRINGVPPGAHNWLAWHHYAFVKNGTSKKVYIDGNEVLSGSNAIPLKTDFATLNIGCDNANGSINGTIDDFSIFAAALSAQEITDLATRARTPAQISTSQDADLDGIADQYEYTYFPADLTKLTATGDFDQDGSNDVQEFTRGTNPTLPDTDNDGLSDGAETGTGTWVSATSTGTNPLVPDTDGDGLTDSQENNSGNFNSLTDPGSNPNKADTDGDGFKDRVEALYGSNPSSAASVPFTPGGTFLLAYWSFNDASNPAVARDAVIGIEGATTGSYTPDGGGHSGSPGDRAMFFDTSVGNQSVNVADAAFMNLATAGDSITISYWQMLNQIKNSSAFWAFSPSSASSARGIQAHTPWSDGNLYFDNSGCCDNQITRIAGPVPGGLNLLQWHHFALVKSGARKQIWIDGLLALDGTGVALPVDINQLTIGGGAADYTNGYIDDFAVFAGGLTPDEISRLSAGESPATISRWPASPFIVTGITFKPNGSIDVTWNSRPGKLYTLQSSLDMITWDTIQSNIPAAGASTTANAPGPFSGTRVFLRVQH